MKTYADEPLNLAGAFPDTPKNCRRAVLHAVGSYREEKKMKRPFVMAIIIALILALLGGTALALVNYYSVRDAVANGTPSREFEENIIPIEQSKSGQGITLSLGDAVFDGTVLTTTLELAHEENIGPQYLIIGLAAKSGDEVLGVDITCSSGGNDGYFTHFFYPSADPQVPMAEKLAVSGEIYDRDADGMGWLDLNASVDWQLKVQVFKPNWEIVLPDKIRDRDAYEAQFAQAYEEGKIMAEFGLVLDEYVGGMPNFSDYQEETWFTDQLVKSGAFSLADTITFDFTAPLPETQEYGADQTYVFDDYTLIIRRLTRSFMRVKYQYDVVFAQPQSNEYKYTDLDFAYALYDQDGREMAFKSTTFDFEEDQRTAHFWGTVEYMEDAPLTAIHFRPDARFLTTKEKSQDEGLWFTVDLTNR